MIHRRYEDHCVGCPQGCISCGRKSVFVVNLYCDKCKSETDVLYTNGDKQLCEDCFLDESDKITIFDVEEKGGNFFD